MSFVEPMAPQPTIPPEFQAPAPQAAAQAGLFAELLLEAAQEEVNSAWSGGSGTLASNPGTTAPSPLASGIFGLGSLLAGSEGAPTEPAQPLSGSDVVADAAKYIGVPYLWGGSSPETGFDCSGLVQRVFGDLGISLPRTAAEQATMGVPVANLASAEPGDLVFFGSPPDHVGIYIGDGKMIDAPHTGTVVSVQAVGDPTQIRRILASPEANQAIPATTEAALLSANAPGPAPNPYAALQGANAGAVPAELAPIFQAAEERFGLPAGLLEAVASVESNFDPSAVSSAGAEGMMQLMPTTAASLGINPFDPTQAIWGAAQLLSSYLARFGSLDLALAAYNAGPGAVEAYGGIPPYPETEAYVPKVLSAMESLS